MRYAEFRKSICCLSTVVFASCCVTTSANAQLFCMDQLVNRSHADRNTRAYSQAKGYDIRYYYEYVWKPEHEEDDETDFYEFQIPMPESLFASGFLIHKGDFVSVFENSTLEIIDQIAGFWARCRPSDSHIYIGLEKRGLKDAWDESYAGLYIIAETQSNLEEFSGLDLRIAAGMESDSVLSIVAEFLCNRPEALRDIWYNADTSVSFGTLEESIQDAFDVTVLAADFTADSVDDFVLKAKRKDSRVRRGESFTVILESGGKLPQFKRWSEFEQIIRSTDSYLLLIRGWQPETGIRGWTLYEGKGDGSLSSVFREWSYSD